MECGELTQPLPPLPQSKQTWSLSFTSAARTASWPACQCCESLPHLALHLQPKLRESISAKQRRRHTGFCSLLVHGLMAEYAPEGINHETVVSEVPKIRKLSQYGLLSHDKERREPDG
jgi:hypothetical protein